MNNLIKFSLSALMLSLLTACADSGDTSKDIEQTEANKPTDTPLASSTSTKTLTVTGGTWASTAYPNEHPQNITEAEAKQLLIDGKVFALDKPSDNFVNLKSAQLNEVVFGHYVDNTKKDSDGDRVTYVYARGNVTPESQVPTAGIFTYTGKAFYGSEKLQGEVLTKNATFKVNFDNKTVSSLIGDRADWHLRLPTATISGNRFSGESGDTKVEGRFFGEKAEELGGIFENNETQEEGAAFMGSFGATQDAK